MDASDKIAGMIPTVVAGGIAYKMTKGMFGKNKKKKKRLTFQS